MKAHINTTEQNQVYARTCALFRAYKLKHDIENLNKESDVSEILKCAIIRQEVLSAHQLSKKNRALTRCLKTLLQASIEAFDKGIH